MRLIKTLRRLARIWKKKPWIGISEYGQLTATNHRVCVGVNSNSGMMGLGLDYPADDAGHAAAESYARTLSNITGLPVVDCRPGAAKRVLEGTD